MSNDSSSEYSSDEETEQNECPFSSGYVLWYHSVVESSWAKESYQNLCIGLPGNVIRSGKDLWRVYRSFGDNITAGMFFLMREGILPLWEDPANAKGGFWSYRVGKRSANEVWSQLSAAFVGNTLMKDPKLMDNITGISVSPKISNCVIKIWNRSAKQSDAKLLDTSFNKLLDPSSAIYRKNK